MLLAIEKGNVQISGNFPKKSFSIRTSAKSFEVFTSKIYTHKARAIIRELSCNAYDSHVEADKKDVPFDIHLPTLLEPWFSIRDYGTGISHEQMTTLYTEFFASTRNESNDFVGALGIGRASPFCLVDSFTIKSYYNGTCRTYSCYKDESGEPQLSLLSEIDTPEDNGVEVSLCVNNKDEEFRREAVFVFTFFDKLPNINDPSVERLIKEEREKFIFAGDDFGFSSSWGTTYAVMGGVAYEIPRSVLSLDCYGYIRFPIGALSFDAGRESLSLDDKTINAVREKANEVLKSTAKIVTDKIEAQTTPYLRAVEAKKYLSVCSRLSAKVKFTDYELPKTKTDILSFRRNYSNSVSKDLGNDLPIGDYVYLYERRGFHKRIREYVRTEGKKVVVLSDDQIKECLIDTNVLVEPSTLPVYKTTSVSVRKRSGVSTFDQKWHKMWREYSGPLDTSEKIYVPTERLESIISGYGNYDIRDRIRFLEGRGIVQVVYGLNPSFMKTKEFKNGKWKRFDVFWQEYLKTLAKPKKFVYNESEFNVLNSISIDHPTIKEWSELVKDAKPLIEKFKENEYKYSKIGLIAEEDLSLKEKTEEIFGNYPMLKYMVYHNEIDNNEVAQYMEMVDDKTKTKA